MLSWDTNCPSLGEACVTHVDAMEAGQWQALL